jgi:hypothetical protein
VRSAHHFIYLLCLFFILQILYIGYHVQRR